MDIREQLVLVFVSMAAWVFGFWWLLSMREHRDEPDEIDDMYVVHGGEGGSA